jgi:hypothetical protein
VDSWKALVWALSHVQVNPNDLECIHQYSYEIASGNSNFPNSGDLIDFGMGSWPLEIQFWEWEDFFVPAENHLPRRFTQF